MADSILPSQIASGVSQTPQVTQGSSSQTHQPGTGPAPGTTLTGFIVNRDASGNPILRTENGDVPFSTNFFLKIGAEVVVRFENRAGTPLAHVLSVNGQPPEIAEGQSAFTEEPDVVVGNNQETQTALTPQTAATTTAVAPQPAGTISGTLLPSAPAATDSTETQPPLTQLAVRIISVNSAPPAINTGPNIPAAQGAPVQGQAAAAYARASGAAPATQPTQVPPLETETENLPIVQTASPPANTAPALSLQQMPVAQPTTTTATAIVAANEVEILPTQTAAAAQPVTQVTSPLPQTTPQTSVIATPAAATEIVTQTIAPAAVTATPPAADPVTLTQGQTITATVISNDANGALVQTDAGMVRLQAGTGLQPGSNVTLQVAQVSTPDPNIPAQAAAQANAPAPLTALARQWGTLQQLVTLVAEHAANRDSNAAANVAASVNLPSLIASSVANTAQASIQPQAISAGLMFFLTALRGGDFRSWLGKSNADWLDDQGHGDLLKRAEGEFTSMARQYSDTPANQWRTLFFPVAVEGEFQQVRMFTKRDRKPSKGSDDKQKTDEDTRFVVEVTLSQMGDLQMDGFVRRQEQTVQFDLYIRSHSAIDAGTQKEILQIYNNIGQLTGYKGNLLFQSVKEFPVNPMEEVIAHAMKTVVA